MIREPQEIVGNGIETEQLSMDAPYKLHIDPERATELAQSGAIILLLDVPTGTVVGIDQQVSIDFFAAS